MRDAQQEVSCNARSLNGSVTQCVHASTTLETIKTNATLI